jgi:hypothetical protein
MISFEYKMVVAGLVFNPAVTLRRPLFEYAFYRSFASSRCNCFCSSSLFEWTRYWVSIKDLLGQRFTCLQCWRIEDVLGDTAAGTLPALESIVGLPDFDWAARRYMNTTAYTYYRNGAAGEWSYRNNLEVYSRYRLKPRVMTDITNIESTLRYIWLFLW